MLEMLDLTEYNDEINILQMTELNKLEHQKRNGTIGKPKQQTNRSHKRPAAYTDTRYSNQNK